MEKRHQSSRSDSDAARSTSGSSENTVDACVCNWKDCARYRKFFTEIGHMFGGDCVRLSYGSTCNSLNLQRATFHNLHVPSERQHEFKREHEAIKSGGKRGREYAGGATKRVRIPVAKHHWSEEMHRMIADGNGQYWTTPVSPDDAEKYQCLIANYKGDDMMKYDPTIGSEPRSATWIKKHPVMYIKSPNNPRRSVKALYNELVSNRKSVEESRDERRSTEEWRRLVNAKDAEIQDLKKRKNALEGELVSMKQKLGEKATESKRSKRKAKSIASKSHAKMQEADLDMSGKVEWNSVMKLLETNGGLSRLTMFSDGWHQNHSTAAKLLFGFRSWSETKKYVQCLFPFINIRCVPAPRRPETIGGDIDLTDMTDFESCLMCRLFFHHRENEGILGLIWNRHRTQIGRILHKWSPYWGEAGEDMSLLDIGWNSYLDKEHPDLDDATYDDTRVVNIDGKDFKTASKRKDGTARREQYSSKTETDASRCLTWSTLAGMIFEYTPLYGARASEKKLQRMWGSLGRANAPLEEWKDAAGENPPLVNGAIFVPPTFPTALDNLLTGDDYEHYVKQSLLGGHGAVGDDAVSTAGATGLEAIFGGDAAGGDGDSSDMDASDNEEAQGTATAAKSWWAQNKVMKRAANSSGGAKKAPLLTPDLLREQNARVLSGGVNASGMRKLVQLERLERLHRAYEAGDLRKCLLSYYLLVTEESRLKVLSWLGSRMTRLPPKPSAEELPLIPLRLAKIPEDCIVLGDKGFVDSERDYPHFNDVDTPYALSETQGCRKTAQHIAKDRPKFNARFPAETDFSRITDEDSAKETIPYWMIPFLPYAHACSHGAANLDDPLRKPGRMSIVAETYWQNKKGYGRRG